MVTAYNVFLPEDLELAQAIYDDAWRSMPSEVRASPRNGGLKDWLAKQVLASVKEHDHLPPGHIRTRLMETDLSAWS